MSDCPYTVTSQNLRKCIAFLLCESYFLRFEKFLAVKVIAKKKIRSSQKLGMYGTPFLLQMTDILYCDSLSNYFC